MGTAVGVGVSIAIDAGMGVAVSVNMDVGGILATFVSAWLLGVGLDCIVPTRVPLPLPLALESRSAWEVRVRGS